MKENSVNRGVSPQRQYQREDCHAKPENNTVIMAGTRKGNRGQHEGEKPHVAGQFGLVPGTKIAKRVEGVRGLSPEKIGKRKCRKVDRWERVRGKELIGNPFANTLARQLPGGKKLYCSQEPSPNKRYRPS